MKKLTSNHRTRVTRTLIRRSFTDLLRKKPIQHITIKELSERAGINRGTFYSHYTDIYDLRDNIENEMTQEFQKAAEPLLHADNGELTPVTITAGIFECLKNNSDLCAVTLGEYGDKEFLYRIINMGRQLCMETYSRFYEHASPAKIEYFYAFISTGCIGLLQKWLDNGMTISSEELAEMTESIITNGIGFLK